MNIVFAHFWKRSTLIGILVNAPFILDPFKGKAWSTEKQEVAKIVSLVKYGRKYTL